MPKIAVAISGGVDSAVAALVMRQSGFDVTGIYLHLKDDDPEMTAAEQVAHKLGIEFEALDLRQEFDCMIKREFAKSYSLGETPNPCVDCNKKIKFGILLDRALELGCEGIATGHYAVCDQKRIIRAEYAPKDQTYCLWQIPKSRLKYIHFPLGNMAKPDVKKLAASAGLVSPDKKESMDICFIPDGDYRRFLTEYTGDEGKKGSFVLYDGTFIGESNDQRCYTIGQRKGLGIAYAHPLYVVSKDPSSNTIVLGKEDLLFKTEVRVRNCNWQQDVPDEFGALVQLRFRASDAQAHIKRNGDSALITFVSGVRAPSPGQSAVVYSNDGILLGGGVIER